MGKISSYTRALVAKLQDVFVVDQTDNNVTTTKSVSVEQIGDTIAGTQTHSTLNTSDKTLIGAIKEVAKDKNIADEYDDTQTYNTGDITIYSNTLYVCQDDNVTGAWDSTKWSATTVDDLIPKTDNNLPHFSGTPTEGSTAYEIASKADKTQLATTAFTGITPASGVSIKVNKSHYITDKVVHLFVIFQITANITNAKLCDITVNDCNGVSFPIFCSDSQWSAYNTICYGYMSSTSITATVTTTKPYLCIDTIIALT